MRWNEIFKTIRNFLFGWMNKEFLIFLFFLSISGFFWLLVALNETYEREVCVPIHITGVPKNVVMTTEMADTIRVTIRGKGYSLASYLYGDRLGELYVDFSQYADGTKGYGEVPLADVQKLLRQRMYGGTAIVSLKPSKLDFYFNYGLSKNVPVRIDGKIEPGETYYVARTRFFPEMVTIYANKEILSKIDHVNTVPLNITNFSDTLMQVVSLRKIKGVKIVPMQVKLGIYPDVMTEESIEVPIRTVNVPEGMTLRTFPSRVKVSFVVGASVFRNISPDQFIIEVDYNEIDLETSDKCEVHLRRAPNNAKNVKLEVGKVDYLIEKQ